MTPRLAEQLVNGSLADLLTGMSARWRVFPETNCFRDSAKCPDILLTTYGRQPVVVENEWLPARTVEAEARSRLGEALDSQKVQRSGIVRSAVALRTPLSLSTCQTPQEVSVALAVGAEGGGAKLEYALFSGASADAVERFPSSGWLSGTVTDLALFLDQAGVSADALRKSIGVLEAGVADVIALLRDAASQSEDWKRRIAQALKQDYHESKLDQMLGIAATIMINAMVFQEGLAGNQSVKNLAQMRAEEELNQAGVLAEWQRVLQINYWSIFHLARELLAGVNPPRDADDALDVIAATAAKLAALGVARSHDLAGTVFQRFIGDRKYLASYYTRSESAAMLAHMAVPESGWKSRRRVAAFRVADYACGTGTLIHAAYHRINRLHEVRGGSPEVLHGRMMEESLTACDIVPSAAHLTAAMLSSVHPSVVYDNSRVLIAEYGERADRSTALGAVDLLGDTEVLPSLFPMSAPTALAGKSGKRSEFAVQAPPSSQDLVIMNPPFTRAMSDWEPGAEGQWKQYRGLGTSRDVQKRMMEREKEVCRGTCYHGSAGIASAFVAVADRMTKKDGAVALVLPLTAVQGTSWRGVRELFTARYEDVVVVGVAAARGIDQSWSADTHMAEVLLTGRKSAAPACGRGLFATLRRRPANAMEATEFARAVQAARTNGRTRTLEGGPFGGTPLLVGEERIGEAVDAPLGPGPWSSVPVADLSLCQSAHQLSQGLLWLPTMDRADAAKLCVRPVGEFGNVGWAANNIANNRSAAFDRYPIVGEPSYPMLWRNDAVGQRQMIVEADTHGVVREGREDKASRIWSTRSWAHHNCDLRFTSQALAGAFTEGRTIGGIGWPNVQLPSQAHEKAYCLWANTTLGLVQYWHHASKQQAGRGRMPVTAIRRMPFLDVTALAPDQLRAASALFDEVRRLEFLPACRADDDPLRKSLDGCVLQDLLELDWDAIEEPLDLLRRKWCAEPSVRAGKRLPRRAGKRAAGRSARSP